MSRSFARFSRKRFSQRDGRNSEEGNSCQYSAAIFASHSRPWDYRERREYANSDFGSRLWANGYTYLKMIFFLERPWLMTTILIFCVLPRNESFPRNMDLNKRGRKFRRERSNKKGKKLVLSDHLSCSVASLWDDSKCSPLNITLSKVQQNQV